MFGRTIFGSIIILTMIKLSIFSFNIQNQPIHNGKMFKYLAERGEEKWDQKLIERLFPPYIPKEIYLHSLNDDINHRQIPALDFALNNLKMFWKNKVHYHQSKTDTIGDLYRQLKYSSIIRDYSPNHFDYNNNNNSDQNNLFAIRPMNIMEQEENNEFYYNPTRDNKYNWQNNKIGQQSNDQLRIYIGRPNPYTSKEINVFELN